MIAKKLNDNRNKEAVSLSNAIKKHIEIAKEYIEAASILLNGYKELYEIPDRKNPLLYSICHAYECYLKASRLSQNLLGNQKSHNLILLSKGISEHLDSGLLEYVHMLSNHHNIIDSVEGKRMFPDRYDDYEFPHDLFDELMEKIEVKKENAGMAGLSMFGHEDAEMKKALDPEYTQLREISRNSTLIIPVSFEDCIETLKTELNKLEESYARN